VFRSGANKVRTATNDAFNSGIELSNIGSLLEHGIASLESAHFGNSPFLGLFLLGSGLERLCKVILFLAGDRVGRTHDVQSLLDRVLKRCFTAEYVRYRAPKEDFGFLSANPHFTALVELLTEFTDRAGRYSDLDRLQNMPAGGKEYYSPWLEWDRNLIEGNAELVAQASNEGGYKYYYSVSVERRRLIEQGLRALSRLFCPMVLDAPSSTSLMRWAELPDWALGETDYRVHLSWQHDPFHGIVRPGVFAYQRIMLRTFPQCFEPCTATPIVDSL
jgi:hypothetical protein